MPVIDVSDSKNKDVIFEYKEKLNESKNLFFTFIDSCQDFICLKDNNFKYVFANKAFTDFIKINEEDLIGETDFDFMDAKTAKQCRISDQKAIDENTTFKTVEEAYGKLYETCKFPVNIGNDKIGVGYYIRDITNQQIQQETINKISETNRIIMDCMLKPFTSVQEQLDYALFEAIKLTESQYGYINFYDENKKEFYLNTFTKEVISDCKITEKQTTYQLDKSGFWGEAVRQRKTVILNDFNASNSIKKSYPEGHVKIEKFMGIPIFENEKIVATIGLANKKSDYSDNDAQAMTVLMNGVWIAMKKHEKEIVNEYLSYHDYLTGIYNRRYFDEDIKRTISQKEFPIAILVGDINGFKIYNDTFGHLEGDKAIVETAKRLGSIICDGNTLARVGGDEFAIILSGKSEEEIRSYLNILESKMNAMSDELDEKRILTISWGYGIQKKEEDTIDTLWKEAESFMYRRKYYSKKSTRSNSVNITMKTLFAKSEREKNHSERVGLLCEAIAKKMHLEKSEVEKLQVAGCFHDIGKIGVDENILNKTEKLTKSEWEILKLHSAKGAGILENTTEFSEISDLVLSHHERYDGSGYPNGIKGEEIPLGARIISVADAFDAMTNERSYKKALSHQEAIDELKKCAGKQFDTNIVDVFITKVLT